MTLDVSLTGPVHLCVLDGEGLSWHSSRHRPTVSQAKGNICDLFISFLWSLAEVCLLQPVPLGHQILVSEPVFIIAINNLIITPAHTLYSHPLPNPDSVISCHPGDTMIDILKRLPVTRSKNEHIGVIYMIL